MKKTTLISNLFIIVILVAGGSWYYLSKRVQNLKKMEPPPVAVEAVPVQTKNIPESVSAFGSLKAKDDVFLKSEMPGMVKAILFQEGQLVEKDTPLVQLDDAVLQAALKKSQAELLLSTQKFNRMQELVKTDLIAKQAFDEAKADVQGKESTVESNRAQVEKMLIKAPFDGTLGVKQVSVGDFVEVGRIIVEIADVSNLMVEYTVSDKNVTKISAGQKVFIHSDAIPDQTFEGQVTFISPTVDPKTRTITVQASLPNDDQTLSPGLSVTITQLLNTIENALTVPEQSLLATISGQKVFKIVDGKAVEATIKIGARFKGDVQVTEGLEQNDLIIISGQQKVKDGQPVSVINQEEKSD